MASSPPADDSPAPSANCFAARDAHTTLIFTPSRQVEIITPGLLIKNRIIRADRLPCSHACSILGRRIEIIPVSSPANNPCSRIKNNSRQKLISIQQPPPADQRKRKSPAESGKTPAGKPGCPASPTPRCGTRHIPPCRPYAEESRKVRRTPRSE